MDHARVQGFLLCFSLCFILKYGLKIFLPLLPLLSFNTAKMIYSEAEIWMVAFMVMAPRNPVKPAKTLPEPAAHYPVATGLMVIQCLKL